MPALIGITDFVEETIEDYKSPTTSTFCTRMTQCRQTISTLEEVNNNIFFKCNEINFSSKLNLKHPRKKQFWLMLIWNVILIFFSELHPQNKNLIEFPYVFFCHCFCCCVFKIIIIFYTSIYQLT